MVMIANLQYGWTLFVNPIEQKYHWGRAAIQVAFTHLRADRDLAGAGRRLVRRSLRPADRRADRRRPGRHRLGDEFACADSLTMPLHRRGDRRHRRGRGLRHLRRQCAQVVPRPARAGRWPDRGRLRRGLGAHHHPDPGHDRLERLSRRRSCGSASARASSCSCCPSCCARRAGRGARRRRRVVQSRARLHAGGDGRRRRSSGSCT